MKNKKAAGLTAAENGLLRTSYVKPIPLSRLKMLLGESLLLGDTEQKLFWKFFEIELRTYLEIKYA